MVAEVSRSERPRRRKAGAKLDRMLIRFSSLATALAALVAILRGFGLL